MLICTPLCRATSATAGSAAPETFDEMSARVNEERKEQEAQALVDMEDYGIKVITPTEDELNALRDRIRAEVWPKLADDLGPDTIDEICDIYGVEL